MDKINEFRSEIIECLEKYCKLTKVEAEKLLSQSGLLDDVVDDDVLFHETPYYWAMQLFHRKSNPRWFHDPNLWPPPDDYLHPKTG